MAFDLTLINAALTRTGNPTITMLDDGTPGSNIAGSNYDLMRKTALTGYPWRWATKTATLAALTGTPAPPWLYAYQLPSDVYHLRVVIVAGQPIDYEVQFNKLLCDIDTSVDVIAKYTWDVPEAYWPADFAEAITQQLEVLFLRGIGERYEEAEARAKMARGTLQLAKLNDSRKQSPRDVFTHPTLAARAGMPTTTPLPWR